ncbi:MAG TPA: 1,6-anhydro-N-acetylmuramyl-L-alanine amidase AmpD [Pseudomonadales bacterium]|nr:1,6-anhydro-N-acetylmuramyl-L-alanine amidase AmpD [Pseudomonadales bacterium]
MGADGWLPAVRLLPTVHFNERPDNTTIDLLVIHNISLPPGQFGGEFVDQLFCGELDCSAHPDFETLQGLRVSAHFFINRQGVVTQYVPTSARAWHAGVSQWDGRENCNDFSIGIELEGTDSLPYTDAQYAALTGLTTVLQQRYPAITAERIVGHSDVAPGRKTDPGAGFDWLRFRSALYGNAQQAL